MGQHIIKHGTGAIGGLGLVNRESEIERIPLRAKNGPTNNQKWNGCHWGPRMGQQIIIHGKNAIGAQDGPTNNQKWKECHLGAQSGSTYNQTWNGCHWGSRIGQQIIRK